MVDSADARSMIDARPESLGRMFFDRVHATPGREAYRYPDGDDWTSVTWGQTGDRVRRIAAGLIALGVEPEQRVAIASSTRFEWIFADLAIMSSGAATTTVYPSSMADDVAFILGDSDSHVVFAEDGTQVAKLREQRSSLPALSKVVVFDTAGLAPTASEPEPDDGLGDIARRSRGARRRPADRRARRGRAACRRHPQRPARDPDLHLGNHRAAEGRAACRTPPGPTKA